MDIPQTTRKPVSDFADIVGGSTPDTKNTHFWDGDIPWITPKDLSNHKERYISKGNRFITIAGLQNSSTKLVPKNTILLTTRAPVGYLAIASVTLCTNQGFRNLVVKDGYDALYVYYLLKANVEYLKSNATGTTFQELTGSTLKELEFDIPPLETQKEIAHILGTLDDKIELNRQMNKTLEEIAQALYKHWFIDFEFPNAEGKPYKSSGGEMIDSELGLIPKGWRVGKLSDEFNITMGQSPPGDTYNKLGDGLPFYQGNADFGFRYPKNRIYCTAPKRLAQAGDTLISVRAPVGDINMAYQQCCIGRGLSAVKHKLNFMSYTYYAMQTLREQFEDFDKEGTVFGSMNRDNLGSIKWITPTCDVIREFDANIDSIDSEISNSYEGTKRLECLRGSAILSLI